MAAEIITHAIGEFKNGTSNTLLVVESANSVPWTKPEDLREIPEFFEGKPINILMADATVLNKDKIDKTLLEKLITRNGGEQIEW